MGIASSSVHSAVKLEQLSTESEQDALQPNLLLSSSASPAEAPSIPTSPYSSGAVAAAGAQVPPSEPIKTEHSADKEKKGRGRGQVTAAWPNQHALVGRFKKLIDRSGCVDMIYFYIYRYFCPCEGELSLVCRDFPLQPIFIYTCCL